MWANSDMDAVTIHIIHNAAWVVVIFTLGMLVGYLLKVVLINRERKIWYGYTNTTATSQKYGCKSRKEYKARDYCAQRVV